MLKRRTRLSLSHPTQVEPLRLETTFYSNQLQNEHLGVVGGAMIMHQGALNPVFLTPFSEAKFYALGMRCFAALFRKI